MGTKEDRNSLISTKTKKTKKLIIVKMSNVFFLRLVNPDFSNMTTVEISILNIIVCEKIVEWFQSHQYKGDIKMQAVLAKKLDNIKYNMFELERLVAGHEVQRARENSPNVIVEMINMQILNYQVINSTKSFTLENESLRQICPVYSMKLIRKLVKLSLEYLRHELLSWEKANEMGSRIRTISNHIDSLAKSVYARNKGYQMQIKDEVAFEIIFRTISPDHPKWDKEMVPTCHRGRD